MLKAIIHLEVYANGFGPFCGSFGIALPANKQSLNVACAIEASIIVNLAAGCLWESCSRAMPCVQDVFVDVEVETELHHFWLRFGVISNDTHFKAWSPDMHTCIETAKKQFYAVFEDMLYDLAIDYYSLDAERRDNHAYTIRRRN